MTIKLKTYSILEVLFIYHHVHKRISSENVGDGGYNYFYKSKKWSLCALPRLEFNYLPIISIIFQFYFI